MVNEVSKAWERREELELRDRKFQVPHPQYGTLGDLSVRILLNCHVMATLYIYRVVTSRACARGKVIGCVCLLLLLSGQDLEVISTSKL